ncbi:MAG TPA: aminotransferase class IV, partial [Anaerolineales bacterium]|nr:aminotransferase class IV [Anaerolineales bacterium]
MESKYIWMDGELVDFDKATVHILNPAMHYGAAVFEGIRAYNTPKGPAVFRLREHAERLLDSAQVFGVRKFAFSAEDIVKAVKETVHANGFTDCYIRPLLFLKGGAWNLNVDAGQPALAIAVWQWSNYLGEEALAKGIRANISSYTRHHPNVSMTKAKIAGNYV